MTEPTTITLTEEQIQQMAEVCVNDPKTYQQFVLNLASKPAGYNFGFEVIAGLIAALHRLTPASLELDHFKRVMTYGEKMRINPSPVSPYQNQVDLFGEHLDEPARLLAHGILGKITEAMELAPILIELLERGTCDEVNLVEELGDDAWYSALIVYSLDAPDGEVIRKNVRKLGKRYKGGVFTAGEALNRNLDDERKALEN